MDPLTALFVMAAMILGLLWFFVIGWALFTAGMMIRAKYRGEDWRRVWDEMKEEW